jgi:predicted nucleic acid-binding protein
MSVIEIPFTPGMALPNTLYVDSNILVAFFDRNHKYHIKASRLLLEAKASHIELYISSLVLDEVWYVLMRSWQKQELGINFDSKKKEHIQLYGTCIERITNDILNLLQAKLLPLASQKPSEIVQCALKFLRDEQIAPRDSYHLAYVITAGVQGLATIDGDFMLIHNPSVNLSVIKLNDNDCIN